MGDLGQKASDTLRRLEKRCREMDWDTLKVSAGSSIRKGSRVLTLAAAISFTLMILVLAPRDSTSIQVLEYHGEDTSLPKSLVENPEQQDGDGEEQLTEEPIEEPVVELTTAEKQHKEQRFALIIPATSPSPDLCKTVMTALALGYPSPVIINWGVDYHQITKWDGGRNLPKIPGFVNYLDAVLHPEAHPSERLNDDDLVLMVDAYDVWFQLPAEVLLKRYHQINKEANARLRQQWKGRGPMPMKQTVIAASGKNCHPQPKSGSDLHCDKLPLSPLREDLYGSQTEKNETKHRDHRPRYINGGVYIGPAGDMRRLFRRALEKMEAGLGRGEHLFSEQGIPGEVMGEQELWRQWRRDNVVTGNDTLTLMARDFEYHFGLDYSQTLSIQTFWTDTDDGLFDGAFVTLNNQTDIDAHSKALGIDPVRLKGIPEDVQNVTNPLGGISETFDWGNLPLYADFFTESVPVILHHNGFKERRVLWWDKPWYQEWLRDLLTFRMSTAKEAISLATVETDIEVITYKPPLAEKDDARPRLMLDATLRQFAKARFNDVCHYPKVHPDGHWWDEVFRDGKGIFE